MECYEKASLTVYSLGGKIAIYTKNNVVCFRLSQNIHTLIGSEISKYTHPLSRLSSAVVFLERGPGPGALNSGDDSNDGSGDEMDLVMMEFNAIMASVSMPSTSIPTLSTRAYLSDTITSWQSGPRMEK